MFDYKNHSVKACQSVIEQIKAHVAQINKYSPGCANASVSGGFLVVVVMEGLDYVVNRTSPANDLAQLNDTLSTIRPYVPADCDPLPAYG